MKPLCDESNDRLSKSAVEGEGRKGRDAGNERDLNRKFLSSRDYDKNRASQKS